jgi:hypothetical protein
MTTLDSNKYGRCVPEQLYEEHKCKHKEAWIQVWSDTEMKVLTIIITGKMTWIHNFKLESRGKLAEWQYLKPLKLKLKTFKSQPSATKQITPVFWNSDCLVLAHTQLKGETTVSDRVKCYRTR